MALYTTKSYIEKAKSVHGEMYDYSKTEYVHSMSKLTITCRLHGDFETIAYGHIAKKKVGCPTCGRLKSDKNRRKTQEEYIADIKAVHGDRFDYSKTVYTKVKSKVTATCRVHGDFQICASSFLTGSGCGKCKGSQISENRRMLPEDFLLEAKSRYGEFYDYSLARYTRSTNNIDVICKHHGIFSVKAGYHLHTGDGCEQCAGWSFKTTQPANLYVMKANNITKVGITNRKPSQRAYEITRDSGYDFKVVSSYKFETGRQAYEAEHALLNDLTKFYEQPHYKFTGSTECFLDVDLDELLHKISQIQEEVY